MKVAVVGGGNAAFGFAAALKLRGFEVALLEAPEFWASVQPVVQQGGIRIRGVVGEGLAELDSVTTDAKVALEGASIAFVCVPAYAQRRMAELMMPHLQNGQIVLLMPGNCGGALAFVELLRASGIDRRPVVSEASSFLLACKKEGSAGVWVRGLKQGMSVATFPGKQTAWVIDALKETFTEFEAVDHVLETSLNNANHVVHPPGILLNLGLVELGKEDWSFFFQGLSQAVCRAMEAIDRERLQILRQLCLPQVPALDWMLRFYSHQGLSGDTLYEALSTTPVHGASKGPRTIEHRYITEDVPFGLVPLASIGRQLGVQMSAVEAMIDLACIVCDRDWWAEGWTVDQIGLKDMSAAQMLDYVLEGSL
jgi:opine dehydrogenase